MLQGSQSYIWWTKDQLGKGATAAVYKCRNKKTGSQYAVKIFNQLSYQRPAEVQLREFEVLRKLKHENIVQLYAVEEEQTTKSKVIVMEYCNSGSLYTILEKPENAFGVEETDFLTFLFDVSHGMKQLHEKAVVHRDIKPGNIMLHITGSGRSIYKLTDFGAARELDAEGESFMSLYGTEEYLHPDLYERAVMKREFGKTFDSSVDLWSLGVTIYHVATGQLPFRPQGGRKSRGTMSSILNGLEAGHISGYEAEDGSICYRRELPAECQLSEGLKQLVTPVLANVFDVKSRRWSLNEYYDDIKKIITKRRVFIADMCGCSILTMFLDKSITSSTQALEVLKGLVEHQTSVKPANQILLFGHKEVRAEDLAYVLDFSSEEKPIFLFKFEENTVAIHLDHLLLPNTRNQPSFNVEQDYTLAKQCAGKMFYLERRIRKFLKLQTLIAQCVREFENYLIEQVLSGTTTLENLAVSVQETRKRYEFFVDHCRSCENLLDEFRAISDAADTIVRAKARLAQLRPDLDKLAAEVKQYMPDLERYTKEYNKKLVQNRELSSKWRREKYCREKDKCTVQIKMLTQDVVDTMQTFRRDRQVRNLGYNEEQIHKFEKNKMSESCLKARTLASDHCFANLRSVYKQFISWYSMSYKVFQKFRRLGNKLKAQREMQRTFSTKLTAKQDELKQVFTDTVKRINRAGNPGASLASSSSPSVRSAAPAYQPSLELSLVLSSFNFKVTEMQTETARMRNQVGNNFASLQRISTIVDSL